MFNFHLMSLQMYTCFPANISDINFFNHGEFCWTRKGEEAVAGGDHGGAVGESLEGGQSENQGGVKE